MGKCGGGGRHTNERQAFHADVLSFLFILFSIMVTDRPVIFVDSNAMSWSLPAATTNGRNSVAGSNRGGGSRVDVDGAGGAGGAGAGGASGVEDGMRSDVRDAEQVMMFDTIVLKEKATQERTTKGLASKTSMLTTPTPTFTKPPRPKTKPTSITIAATKEETTSEGGESVPGTETVISESADSSGGSGIVGDSSGSATVEGNDAGRHVEGEDPVERVCSKQGAETPASPAATVAMAATPSAPATSPVAAAAAPPSASACATSATTTSEITPTLAPRHAFAIVIVHRGTIRTISYNLNTQVRFIIRCKMCCLMCLPN